MPLDPHILLVTFHPATLEPDTAAAQTEELVVALERIDYPVVLTYPNADTHADDVIAAVRAFAARKPATRRLIMNLGPAAYFALMRRAAAMVGNSSSGIIEAASFGLPVVDIGERQRGRAHGVNVLHSACKAGAIESAIEVVLHGDFRGAARKVKNPYGDGHAAERIARVLRTVPLDERLMKKRFQTL
jgi:UDP-hydrolysing UDP-N-acetyl-D-glucosamine 2-epimerase